MVDTLAGLAPRQSVFDRLRAPMAFLLIAACTVGASYYFFLEKKTEYYTSRDARLIARAAQTVTRSVTIATGILKHAATLDEKALEPLYRLDGTVSDEQRLPSKIFKTITMTKASTSPAGDHYSATHNNDDLLLHLQVVTDNKVEMKGEIDLQQLLKPLQHSIAGVFDTVFILDSSGDVIYQSQKAPGDETGSNIKIIRLQDMAVPGGMFEKAKTLKVGELMLMSRQMPVQIGDNGYQLFSVPIHSTVHIVEDAHGKNEAAEPNETWVVCGLISTHEFHARSLQISVTLLSCLAAAVLLVIFSWPFVKTAMTSAQHKTTLFDVVLLGICGILAASVACLVAVDWLTYDKLEQGADEQLVQLATDIEDKFNADIVTAIGDLDALQRWVSRQPASVTQPIGDKQPIGDLLAKGNFGAPFFQTFSLIDNTGQQTVKASVDNFGPPLVKLLNRTYFAAPKNNGREYLSFPRSGVKRRLTIDSVHSQTTGQTEVVFARAADEMPGAPLPGGTAVMAMSVSSPMSVLNVVVPEDFGFAIIDSTGKVLFHSLSERNTVENFFAETDQDVKLRAAVAAHQSETMDIRYWGDDYRAHVHPLKTPLPWTLVTFREKSGLRGVNTEALLTTMLFLLILHVGGVLLFVSIVLLLRPRYRAAWLWPNPNRTRDYSDLAIAYVVLLAVGVCAICAAGDGALVVFPFAFVALVLVITYLYVRSTRRLRRSLFAGVAIVAAVVLAMSLWASTDWDDAGVVAAKIIASVLTLVVLARAVVRAPSDPGNLNARKRQMTLPLAYVSVAALLLLLVSVVPALAFFKAAYDIEVTTYGKFGQIQLARSLQNRWWRLSSEFNDSRGKQKEAILLARWNDRHDIHSDAAASIDLHATLPSRTPAHDDSPALLPSIESILPHYSAASVNTRELLHDRSGDDQWEWTRDGSQLKLTMSNPEPMPNLAISSALPSPFPSFGGTAYRTPLAVVSLLLILSLVLAIAQFVARRVFLVDVVHPLWLSRGFLGLRRVICYPCDEASGLRLFRDFRKLDLTKTVDLELTQTVPQSFPTFARTVLIDHLGYEFATGERAEMVRAMLDRLTRNPDRTVVIRPTAMGVITHAIRQGQEGEAWSRILSSFVWVNGSQIHADARGITFSGAYVPADDSTPPPNGEKGWLKSVLHRVYHATGFGNYFEQMADTRVVERTIAAEIHGDPYLETLIDGLESVASGRDQVLDEIGERAEEYYTALWEPCSASEKLVLMQVAQTGLVNGKARKDVRRLLARGLLRRDPQLRLMNETFRRFVSTQAATSSLATQLEADLAGDAWNRFRVPFFAAVVVALLFFFATQRELFDSTLAVVGGMAATIPALLKMLSAFGERGAAKAA
jgi:hypothetical protein